MKSIKGSKVVLFASKTDIAIDSAKERGGIIRPSKTGAAPAVPPELVQAPMFELLTRTL